MIKLAPLLAVLLLAACSTSQVGDVMQCGGISSVRLNYAPPVEGAVEPTLQSMDVCTGTNGQDREFVYRAYGPAGELLKEIRYGSASTEATTALRAVSDALRAASSNDAAVSQAAIKALPDVLGAAAKIISPVP